MKRTILLACLAALALACASAPKLPPKAGPEEVAFYNPDAGQYPDEGYKTIAPVRAERPLGTQPAELYMALRAEAAKLGADAVIFQRIRRTTEGSVAADLDREEMMIVEGLAVYWPQKKIEQQ